MSFTWCIFEHGITKFFVVLDTASESFERFSLKVPAQLAE